MVVIFDITFSTQQMSMFKLNNKIQYVVDSYISSDYFTYCLGVESQDATKRKRASDTRCEDDVEATC